MQPLISACKTSCATLLVVVLGSAILAAQNPCEATWVFFTDKPGSPEMTEGVSRQTFERRVQRGTPDAKWLASPVSETYLNRLSEDVISIRHTSKWLNAASVCLNPDQAHVVLGYPFVKEVRPVRSLRTTNNRHIPERMEPPPATLLDAARKGPTDSLYGASLTQLEVVNAIEPLELGYNGNGVTIGFLDAAYDFSQPAFQHIVDAGRFVQKNFADTLFNTSLHGLWVASTAVGYDEGNIVGPCWGGNVLAATTEVTAYERNVEEDNFVAGMEWLEEQGADVVNISLGYDRFDEGEHSYTLEDLNGDVMVTSRAADAAVALGVTVVAAAGNEGSCGVHSEYCWYYVGAPAEGDSVIAAGGVSADDSRSRWGGSSVGPTSDNRIKPDVMAQGTGVHFAASGYYSSGSGTSFAAPLVSGVVCQILQANPALNPRDVWQLLTETASQSDAPDNFMGWGIVDAAAAVDRAIALLDTDESIVPELDPRPALYPNPTSHYFRIDMGRHLDEGDVDLVVSDVAGRTVIRRKAGATNPSVTVDVSELPAGVYLVSTRTNLSVTSQKLVVYR